MRIILFNLISLLLILGGFYAEATTATSQTSITKKIQVSTTIPEKEENNVQVDLKVIGSNTQQTYWRNNKFSDVHYTIQATSQQNISNGLKLTVIDDGFFCNGVDVGIKSYTANNISKLVDETIITTLDINDFTTDQIGNNYIGFINLNISLNDQGKRNNIQICRGFSTIIAFINII